ncbi:MAG: 30S ribosomal protein S12 methylthiotransferase RimO [Bacteroidales bacterium]|nr:MAG: 30S ribosomal protein S12 methylthiotransferase RimO [Bacteroidales bacterium]
MKSNPKPRKIKVVTLGCPKNVVDSENLMKQIKTRSIELIHETSTDPADTVIINTCGFIREAKEESIDTILKYVEEKKSGRIRNLTVIGCLSERYKDDLRTEIPEVDRYFGVHNLREIVRSLGTDFKKELVGERHPITPDHYAYLKISEGCDRTCAFCTIPLIRGKHVSKPVEIVVREAETMVNKGVKEIMIIAQDLSSYGLDLYKKQKLKDLLMELANIRNLEWIRLHYAYPARFPQDILPLMREKKNICPYLDIPVQHISENILRRMRRGSSQKEILELITIIRDTVPNIALRTSLMVGHPGETEKEFEELVNFVNKVKFDRLGVFTYSHEEDTYGYSHYRDDIPEEVKTARKDRLMEIQQQISMDLNNNKIGKSFKVIVDGWEGDYYTGRTAFDSPEIDNEVLIKRESTELRTGEFYRVKITGADAFDLYGERCE